MARRDRHPAFCPQATGGEAEAVRLVAALRALAVVIAQKSVLGAVFAGMFSLYLMQYLRA